MMDKQANTKMVWGRFRNDRGVTLVELLIGLVVMGLVSTATYTAYQVCQHTLNTDRQVMEIQQQLRGAFHYMEDQIRIAGNDAATIGGLGVADVQRYTIPNDLEQAAVDGTAAASPVLSLTYALNPTDIAATTVSFYLYNDSVFDDGNDGTADLCVSNVAPGALINGTATRDLVAEDIEAIDFAFAVDQDGNDILDGGPDTTGDGIPDSITITGGLTLWLVDTNNDNILDSAIPEAGGAPQPLTSVAGYPSTVPLGAIEAVRIWMLARTPTHLEVKMRDIGAFQVGRRLVDPPAIDGRSIFRRRLLTANVVRMNK